MKLFGLVRSIQPNILHSMDQAASVISTTNSAIYISFFPRLSAYPIPLPGASSSVSSASLSSRAVFVCANSLVVSDKVVHARTRYNLRVVETLVAARVLALKLSVPVGEKEKVTLREVLGRVVGEDPGSGEDMDLGVLKQALERMIKEAEVLKPKGREEEGITLEEMIEWSGLSEDVFKEVYLSWVDGEWLLSPTCSQSKPTNSMAQQSKPRTSSFINARSMCIQKHFESSSSARSVLVPQILNLPLCFKTSEI